MAIDGARLRRILFLPLSVGGILVLIQTLMSGGPGFDFYAYWAVDPGDPYARMYEPFNAFRYAPPLIWLAWPLRVVEFGTAFWLWFALQLAVLALLTRRWVFAWLLFLPVSSELYHGNVHLLLACALVYGFGRPILWAFLPLSKITTGIPLLWPVVRREIRPLAAVAWAVLVLMIASALAFPAAWPEWISRLLEGSDVRHLQGGDAALAIPLIPRLIAAAAITVWAARRRVRWPLAFALVLSLPELWIHGLSILAAVPALFRLDAGSKAQAPRAS